MEKTIQTSVKHTHVCTSLTGHHPAALGVGELGSKAWGSPPTQSKVPLWLDHRQRGTLLYTGPWDTNNTGVHKKTKHTAALCCCCCCCTDSAHKKHYLWPITATLLFFSSNIPWQGLPVPFAVSLDHGGHTCISCDSNETMVLPMYIATTVGVVRRFYFPLTHIPLH